MTRNPDKTPFACLDLLTVKTTDVQTSLLKEYHNNTILENKLQNAVCEVEECRLAYYKLPIKFRILSLTSTYPCSQQETYLLLLSLHSRSVQNHPRTLYTADTTGCQALASGSRRDSEAVFFAKKRADGLPTKYQEGALRIPQ